jgi:REP element-mobilizing transposase RayT
MVPPNLQSGRHDRGYLPHVKEQDATYFVTFRLADTLPGAFLASLRAEREEIVKRAAQMGREVSAYEERRLKELHSERIECHLDAGHGACLLRQPAIGFMVAQALRYHDGARYKLHAFVVMPNHVHAIVTPHRGYTLSQILHNWKSYTAHQAARMPQPSPRRGPTGGRFWQPESYDHLIRDEAEFERLLVYVVENPVRAGLCRTPREWPYLGTSAEYEGYLLADNS